MIKAPCLIGKVRCDLQEGAALWWTSWSHTKRACTHTDIYIVQLVLRNIELWVGFTDAIDFHKRSKDIAQRNYWDVTVGRGSS